MAVGFADRVEVNINRRECLSPAGNKPRTEEIPYTGPRNGTLIWEDGWTAAELAVELKKYFSALSV
jgi:hypothetical protein